MTPRSCKRSWRSSGYCVTSSPPGAGRPCPCTCGIDSGPHGQENLQMTPAGSPTCASHLRQGDTEAPLSFHGPRTSRPGAPGGTVHFTKWALKTERAASAHLLPTPVGAPRATSALSSGLWLCQCDTSSRSSPQRLKPTRARRESTRDPQRQAVDRHLLHPLPGEPRLPSPTSEPQSLFLPPAMPQPVPRNGGNSGPTQVPCPHWTCPVSPRPMDTVQFDIELPLSGPISPVGQGAGHRLPRHPGHL